MRYDFVIVIPYSQQTEVKDRLAKGWEPFAMYVDDGTLWIALRLPS